MKLRNLVIRQHRPAEHPERRPSRAPGLSDRTIAALVILVLAATVSMVYLSALYQGIVQELSADSALLRAAAAAKLGKFLQSFPVEWDLTPARHAELRDLTKKVLAASLAIETEPKVLKTLTIAIALSDPSLERGDLRALDLSGARAADAYWARIDFTDADFYQADLTGASLRKAILSRAQFRDTRLNDAVLANAFCEEANFKFTDLRGADLSGAALRKASFEGAKVFGVKFDDGTTFGENPDHEVDVSEPADGSQIMSFAGWLERSAAQSTG